MTFKESLDKKLFWDSDFEQLDLEKHKKYIVERVIERGYSMDQIREMIKYYGKEEVKKIIMSLPWLTDTTMHFCHYVFQIPFKDMRCYTKKQLMPQHWH